MLYLVLWPRIQHSQLWRALLFSDKSDMLVNIHSTLQMPSNTPVLTIIDPGNCALAVKRILGA